MPNEPQANISVKLDSVATPDEPGGRRLLAEAAENREFDHPRA
jgi:hypothetical protein